MRIPISIEPVLGQGFRAAAPFGLSADGATRQEACQHLQELVARRIDSGAEFTVIEVPSVARPYVHSWENPAFRLNPDDPLSKEWLEAIAENRRQADAD